MPTGAHSTFSICASRTLVNALNRGSTIAAGVITVSPEARACAMMPRDIAVRTRSISVPDRSCAIDHRERSSGASSGS